MEVELDYDICVVHPSDVRFEVVLRLAKSILNQDRYLTVEYPHAVDSHILAAFQQDKPVGFLRVLIQVVGSAEERPRVFYDGEPMMEAYVEAFGVDSVKRRLGVGTALQEHAIKLARKSGCYQIRSRSPVTSEENYALKIRSGYVVQPSENNDSYYFILKL